ncbi:MAG: hypothetical protein HYU36_25790 [Planctomycetes bacterium]|nr:hypothetical protein [Planctomycetota bacterium]
MSTEGTAEPLRFRRSMSFPSSRRPRPGRQLLLLLVVLAGTLWAIWYLRNLGTTDSAGRRALEWLFGPGPRGSAP